MLSLEIQGEMYPVVVVTEETYRELVRVLEECPARVSRLPLNRLEGEYPVLREAAQTAWGTRAVDPIAAAVAQQEELARMIEEEPSGNKT